MNQELSSKDLENILLNNKIFSELEHRVCSMDGLPLRTKTKSLLIVNSDVHQLRGRHWMAIFIPKDSPPEFFDSLGKCPSSYSHFLIDFLIEENAHGFVYNYKRLQAPFSSSCGLYCIYFLVQRVKGKSFESILGEFSENLQQNNVFIQHFFEDSNGIIL